MSQEPSTSRLLEKLEANVEELSRRGVRTLGDLLQTLEGRAQGERLKQLLDGADGMRPASRGGDNCDDEFDGGDTK